MDLTMQDGNIDTGAIKLISMLATLGKEMFYSFT